MWNTDFSSIKPGFYLVSYFNSTHFARKEDSDRKEISIYLHNDALWLYCVPYNKIDGWMDLPFAIIK